MNPSANVAVPVSVLVTVTLAGPAVPAGVTAVIDVGFTTTTLVAGFPPTVTVAPLANWVPVMVIELPPAVEPEFGETLVIVGELTAPADVVKLSVAPGYQFPLECVQAT